MSDEMPATERTIERQLEGHQLPSGKWADVDGFVGPFRPGVGPRSDPVGWFPTGPEIGERLPAIVARATTGGRLDVEAHRAGRPAVVVVFRSAVW